MQVEGNRHQAALGQGSDPAEEKKELLADFEGKAESCGWTWNGRAAGNEMVPVKMLEKRRGQLSNEIKEKMGLV